MIKYLEDDPHLFAVDPLLVHFVVHVTPLDMYGELVTEAPLFILLIALTEKFSKGNGEEVYLNHYMIFTITQIVCHILLNNSADRS